MSAITGFANITFFFTTTKTAPCMKKSSIQERAFDVDIGQHLLPAKDLFGMRVL